MLFQPSNITPSSFAGVGGDLVDAADGMTISWQVNGTSAMTGYIIEIFANTDAAPKLLTVTQTLTTPFYGTDGQGNPQRYSATISASQLSTAGITNGFAPGYKYVIWQEYKDAELNPLLVKQTAENFFTCQAKPTVVIGVDVSTRQGRLRGTWSQAQGVGMAWVRWRIYEQTAGELVHDSGRIYTQVLNYPWDGWLNLFTYTVQLDFQLENGYTGTRTAENVEVSWNEAMLRSAAYAERMPNCADILLTYPLPTTSSYTTSTPYTGAFAKGRLVLGENDSITFYGKNEAGTDDEYSFVWCGMPIGTVTITTGNPMLTVTLNPAQGMVSWNEIGGASGSMSAGTIFYRKLVTVIGQDDRITVVVTDYGTATVSGVYTTHRMLTLIPGMSTAINGAQITADDSITLNGTEYDLTLIDDVNVYTSRWNVRGLSTGEGTMSIQTFGAQECVYMGIIRGDTVPEDIMDELETGTGSVPEFTSDWMYLTNFQYNSYAFGNISEDNLDLYTGLTIYRLDFDGTVIRRTKLAYVQSMDEAGQLIDYGARYGHSYIYEILYDFFDNNLGALTYLPARATTGEQVSSCGWDWYLVTAVQNETDGSYRLTGEYRFGLNVETGAMSNNNQPAIMQNFTQYPTVQKPSANYKTGSLTAYIGSVDAGTNQYIDTSAQADAILALSTADGVKFLRNRKGDMWMVEVSSAIGMNLGDKYKEQPYVTTLNWVETGDATEAAVVCLPTDAAWPL